MTRPGTPRPRTDTGASAVEYGLLVAGVAAGLVLVLFGLQRAVGAAYVATSADIQGAPPVATTSAPGPGPTTTTPAPTTTTPGPTTTTPGPTTTTPGPTSTTPTPTPTQPAGSVAVRRGTAAPAQVIKDWTPSASNVTTSVSPAGAGTVTVTGGQLVFTPGASATPGTVTVTWSLVRGSKTYTGTITYWVT